MKSYLNFIVTVAIFFSLSGSSFADCSLDHFPIGCNPDGVVGTDDDNKLFVDCSDKYRHSDPAHSGDPTWLNWYYPLYYNPVYSRYQIGEPGFDTIDSGDPNRQLTGTPDVDYRIIIECVSITSGFIARNSTLGIEIDEVGDFINHSGLADSHLHLEYRAPFPSGATDMQWITYILYDAIDGYEPSEPFSVVFVKDPLAGDLVIDGIVDINDLAEFCYYWLQDNGDKSNDYYERSDANRDGQVDFWDFAILANHWLFGNE
jgi:dockerin type I repeat protein